jgi:hypothetical protein
MRGEGKLQKCPQEETVSPGFKNYRPGPSRFNAKSLRRNRLGVFSTYRAFGCHRPNTAPVGSVMMLSDPIPITSVTSFMIVAPSDFAFFVAAAIS